MAQEPRGRFPNYWCHLSQPDNNIDILADLPEEFSYTAMSHYMGPTGTISGGLSNAVKDVPLAGEIAQMGAGVMGGDVAVQAFTKRIWQGSEPIQFSLRLMFDAENNSYEDVHETLTLLASLALPSSWGGGYLLRAPNPYHSTAAIMGLGTENNKLSVRIGRQYLFESVVILSAAPAVDIRVDADGYPIAGAIDLQCCTDFVLHKDDLFKAAGVRGLGSNSAPTRANISESSGLSPVRLMKLHNGEE